MSGLTDLQLIDQVDYKEILEFSIPNNLNVIVLGPSGTGKTIIPDQVCSALGYQNIRLNLSVLERTDLLGLPEIVDHKQRYATPEFLPVGNEPKKVIILDELDKAAEELQAPLLELLQFNTVNFKPVNIQGIVATGNLPEEGAFSKLLNKALTNRAMVYELQPKFQPWRKWAEARELNPLVIQFVSINSDYWLKPNPSETAYAHPCPRMWEYAATALDKLPDDANPLFKSRVVAGFVGQEAAVKFHIWLEYYRDLDIPIKNLFKYGTYPDVTTLEKKLICSTAVVSKFCRMAIDEEYSKKEMHVIAKNVFGWLSLLEKDIVYGAMTATQRSINVLYKKYQLGTVEEFNKVWEHIEEVAI